MSKFFYRGYYSKACRRFTNLEKNRVLDPILKDWKKVENLPDFSPSSAGFSGSLFSFPLPVASLAGSFFTSAGFQSFPKGKCTVMFSICRPVRYWYSKNYYMVVASYGSYVAQGRLWQLYHARNKNQVTHCKKLKNRGWQYRSVQ